MTPEKLGSVIGAVFGLVFVLANTGSLPSGVALTLRVLGGVAFLAVLLAVRRPAVSRAATPAGSGFGRGYWLVVGLEVVAIFGGLALLNGPLDTPQAAVAWISFVVGVHFLALAVVWRQRLFTVLGAALAVCGLAGLGLAVGGAPEAAVDTVGGVLPGAVLLGFALRGSTTGTSSASPATR